MLKPWVLLLGLGAYELAGPDGVYFALLKDPIFLPQTTLALTYKQNRQIPGGQISTQYDDVGRPLAESVTFNGSTDNETFTYDGMGRLLTAQGAGGVIAQVYDVLGVMRQGTLSVGGLAWTWSRLAYRNGAPRQLTYPSGQVVNENRSSYGRLNSLTAQNGGTVATIQSYAMAQAPGEISLGNNIVRHDEYDIRRRLLARRYTVGNQRVAEVRYAYDTADREVARQWLDQGARTDFYGYDSGSRLTRVERAARPSLSEPNPAPWSVAATLGGKWRAGAYGRTYTYDSQGQDRVATSTTQSWPGETYPVVAQTLGDLDSLGHTSSADGALRSRDPLGNTTRVRLGTGTATLSYDGRARLRQVLRSDGSQITYRYRGDGILSGRTVVCAQGAADCQDADEVYVYEGLRLLEVYDVSQGRVLLARYYYADEGDIPIAADFRQGQNLVRHYLVVDRQGSVWGILNAQGQWVERISYDPWGRPEVTTADNAGPLVQEIRGDGAGGLWIIMSEAVLPPPVIPSAPNLATSLSALSGLTISDANGPVDGVWQLDDRVQGAPRGTALHFVASTPLLAATYNLEITAASVLDAYGNPNPDIYHQFVLGTGVAYTGPPYQNTESHSLSHSAVGNHLYFQAHLYDPDAQLILARARVADPHTGLFLQQDPEGYEDSVNLYAFLAHDSVNNRDPTGKGIIKTLKKRFMRGKGKKVKARIQAKRSDSPDRPDKLDRAKNKQGKKDKRDLEDRKSRRKQSEGEDEYYDDRDNAPKGAGNTALARYEPGLAAPVEIRFPARGLSSQQRSAFTQHLTEQEAELNALSLFRRNDLEFNLANYDAAYVDAARALGRQYLPGPAAGRHAAHALDSIAGGYPHKFVGFRDPIQSRIGALWRTRRTLIEPGRQHRLIPDFGD